MRVLVAIIRKEFLQVVRDPSALLIAFCLPLILLFIFGYGVNLDSSRLKAGLVVEGSDADSAAAVDSVLGSSFFDVRTARTRQELEYGLVTGDIRALVVVPASLQRSLEDGTAGAVQVLTDGTEPNSALFARNYAAGAMRLWLDRRRLEAGGLAPPALITVESRFWYNQELKSRNYLVPGSMAIIMTLVGVMLTSLVVSREWERGTMEALMATPVTIGQIIGGKLAAYYLLALASAFLSLAAAVYWYEVPFRGSLFALLVLSTAYILGALGQGLLISTVARNQFLSAQLAIITGFMPSFMLSGFVFEVASIPSPIRELTYLVPARHLVPCLQTIFLVGDVWPLFLRSMAPMLGLALVFFLITAKATVRKVI